MTVLRQEFFAYTKDEDLIDCPPRVLVVAVRLPTGATETIVNYEGIAEKIQYYKTAYDDEFRLKTNPNIKIIGFMLV